jgi:hypothetical protein
LRKSFDDSHELTSQENSSMRRSQCIHIVRIIGLAFFLLALPVRAGTIAADALPLPNRAAGADVIVLGKITAIEDKSVLVAPFPGAGNKTEYRVAVLTISEAVKPPRGAKTIRLGFVPLPPGVAVSPPPFQPTVGLEGCFFLTKLGDTDFLVAPSPLNFLTKTNATFPKDIALIKRCTAILANPNLSLKAKDAEERFLAAAMLMAQYRTRRSPKDTTEPISAEQSKLILQALATADWTPTTDFTKLSPLMVLHRLPLTAKDGWAPPSREPKAYAAYAQQWVRDHAGSYRIERFVAAKNK